MMPSLQNFLTLQLHKEKFMGLQIIIRGKNKYGKTRSEQESNLRKDGFVSMTDENYDKAKYVEKKIGAKGGFFRQADLEKVK
jgi:hypothetical protein